MLEGMGVRVLGVRKRWQSAVVLGYCLYTPLVAGRLPSLMADPLFVWWKMKLTCVRTRKMVNFS